MSVIDFIRKILLEILMLLIILLIFPVICLLIIFNAKTLAPSDLAALKVLIFLGGPFISAFWFGIQVRWFQKREFFRVNGYEERINFGAMLKYFFLGVFIAFIAGFIVARIIDEQENPTLYFTLAVLACFSPSLGHLGILASRKLSGE